MRIRQLSKLIANQIAAGEVVERPASVLKELLENSCDAGSDQINIFVERGGVTLIKIQDNGHGIYKEDLPLAVAQHATSKIETVDDLNNIASLGFRGEALASISSVSKLQLISKPIDQDMGWNIKMEDAEQPIITPAAHNQGTTVVVEELFYNTPARRKFLRAERTEFNHLEEVFKRIALSQFHIGFIFSNNDKVLKKLPICNSQDDMAKRVEKICGRNMVAQSLYIDAEQNGVRLKGWLGLPQFARAQADLQYFFINNRIVKDKVINHAVRAIYNEFCEPGRYPFYCLYLELDTSALDVNVHPTKHEVRFREARVIHQFLTSILKQALSKQEGCIGKNVENNIVDITDIYKTSNVRHIETRNSSANETAKLLGVFDNRILLASLDRSLLVLNINMIRRKLLAYQCYAELQEYKKLKFQHLLEPETVVDNKALKVIDNKKDLLLKFGFEIDQMSADTVIVRSMPELLSGYKINWLGFFENLADCSDDHVIIDAIVNSVCADAPCSIEEAEKLLNTAVSAVDANNTSFVESYKILSAEDLLELL